MNKEITKAVAKELFEKWKASWLKRERRLKEVNLFNKLSKGSQFLYLYLSEERMKNVYLFKTETDEGSIICGEIDTYTPCGVNMIITLVDFSFSTLEEYYGSFDVDEEIDLHREDEDYKSKFSIRDALEDFERFEEEVKDILDGVRPFMAFNDK